MKINYEELMQYYEVADNGEPSDGEYEDAVDAIVCRVPFIVKEYKELETENKTLREQIQSRQELVEQYEQDITRLRRKIRELERQTVVLASHLSKHVMHTMSTKEWLEWSESVAKETGK